MDPGLSPACGTVTFKLLVSNEQAGAIIGKSGAQITALQEGYGVYIKLGGPEDLFPGTFFRAAVVRGDVKAVRAALASVVDVLWKVRLADDARWAGCMHCSMLPRLTPPTTTPTPTPAPPHPHHAGCHAAARERGRGARGRRRGR